ncbi:GldG family protein [Spirochaeta cellobiosiphila]|uniref:GldG family protein n=1 Tax=Spirochaeta cellobiosiphila TaxID=504483 RepID=UPI000426A06B|nr:GldG family protein [Spirochaeta cellobiosiphila]
MKLLKNIDSRVKLALYSVVVSLLVLTLLVIFNLIVGSLNLQIDMTQKSIFSLSAPSKELLKSLDDDVTIYALYKPGKETALVKGILDEYAFYSHVKLSIIDPDRNPDLLKPYTNPDKPLSIGSIIITSKGHFQVLHDTDLYIVDNSGEQAQVYGLKAEQLLSSAIAYVKSGRQPKVYEVTGHRERSFLRGDIETQLKESNYKLSSLDITREGAVPSDADMLLIIGPQEDFTSYEANILNEYLQGGGKLFIAIGFSQSELPNLEEVLGQFNIAITNGIVMERDSKQLLPEFNDNPFFFIPTLGEDGISQFINQSQMMPFFAAAAEIKETEAAKKYLKFEPFLQSSSRSWLRLDTSQQDMTQVDSDKQGPITLGARITQVDDDGIISGTKIVVISSPTAFSNMGGIGIFPGNIKLLIGSLNWMDDYEVTISVPSRSLLQTKMQMNTRSAYIWGAVVTILIPFIIMITGIIIYKRRKNL